ncbi:MAG TPA: LysR family transcriptional regulator [Gemmataceae bacterium]|nr:LysR family transcriptional regulator [Gemmataceae bacterium]
MQFESLKMFCDVVRNKSFSLAALENHVTQSAASQVVSQLEKRLGVELINRSGRPLKPTATGQVYYEGCKELVERYLELEASIRNAPPELPVTVHVAAIYSVGLGDMGQYVERFAAWHPHARVQIEYLHPDQVHEKVLNGTADLGLLSFPPRSRELRTLPWREEEMVLTCSPQHPLTRYPAVRPEQLAGEKYIGFSKDLTIRRKVDQFLRHRKVCVEITLELDNVESIKKAIEDSVGVALLPEPTLRREVQARTLVALPLLGSRFVRPLGIILRRHHRLSSSALRFIELLQHPDVAGLANGSAKHPLTSELSASSANHSSYRGRNGSARAAKKKDI